MADIDLDTLQGMVGEEDSWERRYMAQAASFLGQSLSGLSPGLEPQIPVEPIYFPNDEARRSTAPATFREQVRQSSSEDILTTEPLPRLIHTASKLNNNDNSKTSAKKDQHGRYIFTRKEHYQIYRGAAYFDQRWNTDKAEAKKKEEAVAQKLNEDRRNNIPQHKIFKPSSVSQEFEDQSGEWVASNATCFIPELQRQVLEGPWRLPRTASQDTLRSTMSSIAEQNEEEEEEDIELTEEDMFTGDFDEDAVKPHYRYTARSCPQSDSHKTLNIQENDNRNCPRAPRLGGITALPTVDEDADEEDACYSPQLMSTTEVHSKDGEKEYINEDYGDKYLYLAYPKESEPEVTAVHAPQQYIKIRGFGIRNVNRSSLRPGWTTFGSLEISNTEETFVPACGTILYPEACLHEPPMVSKAFERRSIKKMNSRPVLANPRETDRYFVNHDDHSNCHKAPEDKVCYIIDCSWQYPFPTNTITDICEGEDEEDENVASSTTAEVAKECPSNGLGLILEDEEARISVNMERSDAHGLSTQEGLTSGSSNAGFTPRKLGLSGPKVGNWLFKERVSTHPTLSHGRRKELDQHRLQNKEGQVWQVSYYGSVRVHKSHNCQALDTRRTTKEQYKLCFERCMHNGRREGWTPRTPARATILVHPETIFRPKVVALFEKKKHRIDLLEIPSLTKEEKRERKIRLQMLKQKAFANDLEFDKREKFDMEKAFRPYVSNINPVSKGKGFIRIRRKRTVWNRVKKVLGLKSVTEFEEIFHVHGDLLLDCYGGGLTF